MDASSRREHRRSRRLLRQMDRDARRADRRSRRRRPAAVALALGTALAAVGLAGVASGWDLTSFTTARPYVEVDGRAIAVPRPVASEGRLRPAVPVTTDGAYAFLHTDEAGNPVGYDPCRPVEYVVRPDGAPSAGPSLIEEAVEIVAAATGLEIVQVGETDEPPTMDRPLIQPDRYGNGWAPVLVAWSGPDELPELMGQVAGVGGSAAVPGSDGRGQWLAAGRLALDSADISALLARTDGYAQARAIVVHEFAHVLGLDHVDDPGELMHPITSHRSDLGPGDRAGLALVGQVACEG